MYNASMRRMYNWPIFGSVPFSFPEAALLLVRTKNRDLWPRPTPEVRDSRHSVHAQSSLTNLIGWEYETITLRMLRKLDLPRGRDSLC